MQEWPVRWQTRADDCGSKLDVTQRGSQGDRRD